MAVMSRPYMKKSWQSGRERVSVLAALAIHKETVMQRLLQIRWDHREEPDKPLSMEKAAARVDVSWRTWQRWEAGDSIPYPRNLGLIADAYGFNVSEFYNDKARATNGKTPDPFANPQLAKLESKLDGLTALVEGMAARLERLEKRLADEDVSAAAADVAPAPEQTEETPPEELPPAAPAP